MSTQKQRDALEAKEMLSKWLKPGMTIWCNLRHVSRSGMYRAISLHIIEDNEMRDISGYASRLLEGYDSRHNGCRASGCGMDMGFHLVYNLGYALYPEGFDCTGERCRSNDHSNGDRDYTPHHHSSGGYAFECRWL